MKRKMLALLMTAAMSASLLAGCGSASDSSSDASGADTSSAASSSQTEEEGDPYEITMQVVTWGQTPDEIDQVEEAINAIILPEINATVSLQPVAAWDIINESQMALTSGEKMDIVNVFVYGAGMDSISNYTSKNMLLPLNDLVEEYGADIKDTLGDLLQIGYQGSELYAIPSNTTMGSAAGLMLRKDYLDAVGITIDDSKVYTMDEAEEVLLTLKDYYGDGYYGLALYGTGQIYHYLNEVDLLGGDGSTGVIMDSINGDTTIVNLYETDEYMEFCKTMYRWAQEGLINPDAATMTDDVTSLMQTGYYFASLSYLSPGGAIQFGNQVGTDMVEMKVVEACSSTTAASQALYAIAQTSENPEKVMQFLNILYEDRELSESVSALLNAGLEGVSYEIVESGEGSKAIVSVAGDSLWSSMVPAVYGDALTCPKYEPLTMDIYDEYEECNETISNGRVSATFGYVFDSSDVSAEAAAVSAVVTQYQALLQFGSVDPEETIPEFIQALKDAGIDTVIAENQAQLDAWLAAK